MSQDTTRYDSTVTPNNRSDSGSLYVPAQAQRDLGICIGTKLEVAMSGFEHEFITSVEFEGQQVAGDTVTVPAKLMRHIGIEDSAQVEAEFEVVEDDDVSDLGASKGAVDDEAMSESISDGAESAAEEILNEMDESSDDEEEVEEESEGLGELFG